MSAALRRISTRRLLLICALALAVVGGGTAVAIAATGDSGSTPPPKPLAKAVEDALNAPEVPGISARIDFTNNLIDASSIQGADPILAGASGRLWASPADGGKLRLELQAEAGLGGGDSQLLVDGRRFQLYDGSSETVYEGTLPDEQQGAAQDGETVPGLGEIETEIGKAEKHAEISAATPSNTAGQPSYTVRIAPKHDGGLLGGVELSWDASNGVPLRGAIYSSDSSSPVVQLEATDVSFEAIPSSVFEVSPPAGAKVVNLNPEEELGGEHGKPQEIVGEQSVSAAVDFPLDAPTTLAGLPRNEVRAITVDGTTAALATYGEGLGGIAVIEAKSEAGQGGEGDLGGVSLPKVSINGVEGEELDTALGTALRFSRGGVDYIVLGSVPPAAAEAAARAL
jgi:outer membrane lipoprotein-sorting protein